MCGIVRGMKYTDAEFEVVGEPTRKELPRWFKVTMLSLCWALLFALGVWKASGQPTVSPIEAATVEQPAQPAR